MEYVPHNVDPADSHRKLQFLSVALCQPTSGDEAFRLQVKAATLAVFQRSRALLNSAGRGVPKEADDEATCPYGSMDDGSFCYQLNFPDGWSIEWVVKDRYLKIGIRRAGHDEWEVVRIELPARES